MSIQSAIESPSPVRRRYALAGLSKRNRPHIIGVGVLTAIIAAIYSGYGLVMYATYRESNYDLVIFDQAIRSYSRFHLGISVIKGLHDGFGPNFSVLGDHISPIDMALAPLYWIWNGPQTLIVAQAVLLALAIPWLWRFTRRAMGGSGRKATAAAYLACVGYGVSWPVAAAAAFDYHEVAFVPVLTAIALERLQVGRLRPALIALGVLLLVKEDMGLLVAGIGIALAVSFSPTVRRQRLLGIVLVVVGVGYTVLATDVLIPAFGGRASYYWAYSQLGSNLPQAVGHLLSHPGQFFRLLVTPSVKLRTWEWLFAAFCLLPLLSPLALAVLPLLLERMLSDPAFAHWWGTHFQYNAFIVTILAFAAVDGAVRLGRWTTHLLRYLESRSAAPGQAVLPEVVRDGLIAADGDGPSPAAPVEAEPPADVRPVAAARPAQRPGAGFLALACCVAICAAAIITVPLFNLGKALHPSFYEMTPRTRAIAAADAVVPAGVVVAAANFTGSELSGRDTVLMWDGGRYTPAFAAPWVVADIWRSELGFRTVADQRANVALLERHGYRVMFQRNGILVLHRAGPARLGMPPGPPHISSEAAG